MIGYAGSAEVRTNDNSVMVHVSIKFYASGGEDFFPPGNFLILWIIYARFVFIFTQANVYRCNREKRAQGTRSPPDFFYN